MRQADGRICIGGRLCGGGDNMCGVRPLYLVITNGLTDEPLREAERLRLAWGLR